MKIRQSNSLLNSYGPLAILIFIWMFAFMLSSPLFLFNILHTISLNLQSKDINFISEINTINSNNISEMAFDFKSDLRSFDDVKHISINHCVENSPFHSSRLLFSYASLLIQYTLPFLIVGIAYGSIWWKLKSHREKLKHHQKTSKNMKRVEHKSESNNLAVKVVNGRHSLCNPSVSSPNEIIEKKPY